MLVLPIAVQPHPFMLKLYVLFFEWNYTEKGHILEYEKEQNKWSMIFATMSLLHFTFFSEM